MSRFALMRRIAAFSCLSPSGSFIPSILPGLARNRVRTRLPDTVRRLESGHAGARR